MAFLLSFFFFFFFRRLLLTSEWKFLFLIHFNSQSKLNPCQKQAQATKRKTNNLQIFQLISSKDYFSLFVDISKCQIERVGTNWNSCLSLSRTLSLLFFFLSFCCSQFLFLSDLLAFFLFFFFFSLSSSSF